MRRNVRRKSTRFEKNYKFKKCEKVSKKYLHIHVYTKFRIKGPIHISKLNLRKPHLHIYV